MKKLYAFTLFVLAAGCLVMAFLFTKDLFFGHTDTDAIFIFITGDVLMITCVAACAHAFKLDFYD